MRDVTSAFDLARLNDGELLSFLTGKLGQAQFTSETKVDLPSAEDPRISLHYDQAGEIAGVWTSMADAEISDIVNDLAERLLSPTHRMISRSIVFAARPARGTWQCSAFRLVRPPSNAPRPPAVLGDHPIVFEFAFDATEDDFFNSQRAAKRRHEYLLLLSLFVPELSVPSRQATFHWGISLRDASPDTQHDFTPRWFQEFYSFDGFRGQADDYSTLEGPPLPLVADHIFYGRPGRKIDAVFDVPSSLTGWVEKYFTLPPEIRRRVLRAAHWLRHARDVERLSPSAVLLATIQSVEALLPKASGERCGTCGLMTGAGPTKRFTTFLDEHAPLSDDDDAAARKSLYRRRSQIAHGHELLLADEEIQFGWEGPASVTDWRLLEAATRLVRRAVIDWFDRV